MDFSPLREGDGLVRRRRYRGSAGLRAFQSPSRRGRPCKGYDFDFVTGPRQIFQSPSRRGRPCKQRPPIGPVQFDSDFSPLREGDGLVSLRRPGVRPKQYPFQSPSRRGRPCKLLKREGLPPHLLDFSPLREGDGLVRRTERAAHAAERRFQSPSRRGRPCKAEFNSTCGRALSRFQSPSRRGRPCKLRGRPTCISRRLHFSPLREGDGLVRLRALDAPAHEANISVPFAKGTAL